MRLGKALPHRSGDARARPKSSWLQIILLCASFGIAAGLAERWIYSRWPLRLGLTDVWYSSLVDLLVFVCLAPPAIAASFFWRKVQPLKTAVVLCSVALSVNCLSIIFPPYHKVVFLGVSALLGMLAAFVYSKLEQISAFFWRGIVVAAAIYGIFYFLLAPAAESYREHSRATGTNSAQPNVLLIIVDALRADHLSAYGYSRATSTALDQFASQGMLFENAVAPSSWTLPSHASMLTGRYPSEHQAGQDNIYMDDRFPTLGEAMQRLGYRTAAFSANQYAFSRHIGLGRGFTHFEDGSLLQKLLQSNFGKHLLNVLGRFELTHDVVGRQNAATISRHALRWIDDPGEAKKPFFVTVNYFDVHEPFMPPPEYMRRFSARPARMDQMQWPEDVQLNPQQVADEIDAYDASIAYTSDQISYFLQGLQQRGVLKNTIVIITSDHGQAFNEQGFIFHMKGLYWNLIHSPLLIYAPGRVPEGLRISTPVALQSLPATIMELVSNGDGRFPGPSLAQLWKSPTPQSWPNPVSELALMKESSRFPSYYGPLTSTVTRQWHFIDRTGPDDDLYFCCGQEVESNNLMHTERGRQVAAAFKRIGEGGPAALAEADPSRPPTAEVAKRREQPRPSTTANPLDEKLRALGYIH